MAFFSSIYADTYKYVDDNGQVRFVIRISDIPERYRDRAVKVLVSRGKKSNNSAADEQWPDKESAFKQQKDVKEKKTVEIYITSWCPQCARVEKFLKKNKIKYIKYDVEKSRLGKAKYNKLGYNVVPVTKIGSEVIVGYDPRAILSACNP